MKYGGIGFLCVILLHVLIVGAEYKECRNRNYHQIEVAFELPTSYKHDPFCRMHQISVSSRAQHSYEHKANYYAYFTAIDFKNMFADVCDEYEILKNYELYAYPTFCAYARTLPMYNSYIISLAEKIKTDKQFRKKTAYVHGFDYHFGLQSERSGFHDFVKVEADRAIQLQAKKQEKIAQKNHNNGLLITQKNSDQLAYEWLSRSAIAKDSIRLEERLVALHAVRKMGGIALDEQLRKELSQDNSIIAQLERSFGNEQHIKILAPFVRECAADALKESCPITAFGISDICHAITDVLSHGMSVLHDASFVASRGIIKGAQTFASIDHLKDMATSALHMGLLCFDTMVVQDIHIYCATILDVMVPHLQVMQKLKECNRSRTQTQIRSACQAICDIHEKICAMSWQEIIENGSACGITMILDTLAFHAVGEFSRVSSKAFIHELTKAHESGALFTKEYVLEVAGFGKLIIEEGIEISTKSVDVIKKDLVLCADNQSVIQQIRRKVCPLKWAEDVAHKIRNVSDDILDVMEKAGGHTLERHVGKSYDYLRNRAAQIKTGSAGTFINKRIAVDAVKENLRNNVEKISSWLIGDNLDQIVIEFSHRYPIGQGIHKGKNQLHQDLMHSRIVINRDSSQEWGFIILTAFPIVK